MSSGRSRSERNRSQRSGDFAFGLKDMGSLYRTISFFSWANDPFKNSVPFLT